MKPIQEAPSNKHTEADELGSRAELGQCSLVVAIHSEETNILTLSKPPGHLCTVAVARELVGIPRSRVPSSKIKSFRKGLFPRNIACFQQGPTTFPIKSSFFWQNLQNPVLQRGDKYLKTEYNQISHLFIPNIHRHPLPVSKGFPFASKATFKQN